MRPPDLAILEAVFLPRFRGGVDRRYRDFAAVHLQVAGRVELRIDGRRWELSGPWLWCHLPPHRCAVRPLGLRRHYRCRIAGPLASAWQTEGLLPPAPVAVADPAAAVATFERILRWHRAADPRGRRIAAHAVEDLLLRIAPGADPDGADPWADGLAARIAADPAGPWTVEHLAGERGVAPATLARAFRRRHGTALRTWLLARRCDAAAALLRQGLPVASAAAQVGFADPAYFARQFRRSTGTAPRAVRGNAPGPR
ncbi:MAG: hypothetical protein RLZZ127_446 [Planctomycetota bacterium]|jgi:AraC-like DNA-binding protein